MPLRAVCDTGNLHAFEFNATEWLNLKNSYRSMGLRMPCCTSSAIPKTSSLGIYFFAHSRVGNCTSALETPEHLYCKRLIAQAARDAGWATVTEKTGVTPAGDTWVADVFCEKGIAKIAFEVQMSPQTHHETMRRQLRYKESGVRGAWFYGPKLHRHVLATDRNTPIFKLSEIESGRQPNVEGYGVPLSEFVSAMLTKRLVWTRSPYTSPFYLGYFKNACGKCGRLIRLTYWYSESSSNARHGPLTGPITTDSISIALGRLREIITNDELECLGFASILTVYSGRQVGYHNCNCRRCGMMFSNETLAHHVNMARYSPTPNLINADGELIDHPLGIDLIDRNNDDCGYWTLRPLAP